MLVDSSGMVQAGDQLRAINGRSVQHCSLTQAGELLKASGDIVTLQICKDSHVVGKCGLLHGGLSDAGKRVNTAQYCEWRGGSAYSAVL